MKEWITPEAASAAGAAVPVLTGWANGSTVAKLTAMLGGLLMALFLGPAAAHLVSEIMGYAPSRELEAGVHFLVGLLGLGLFKRIMRMRFSASVAGVSMESKGDD